MTPRLLSRSRWLSGCLALAAAVLVAGCSTSTPAPTVSGKTLIVYLSAPASLSGDPGAQDVIDAERLAFKQYSGGVSVFSVNLRVVTANKLSDNARRAIEDTSAVGYLGEVQPGTSGDSLGITNAEDLLQVSPAEGPPVRTSEFESFSTYGRTFASMAPASTQQAQAILGTPGGKAFVREFRSAYQAAPSPQAILGYVAAAALLQALHDAGPNAANRGRLVTDFFAQRNVKLSVGAGGAQLCTYSVNPRGTVTLTPPSGSAGH